MYNLLNTSWIPYAVDGLIALVILAYAFVSAKKGFVDCFFGFVSTVLAVVVAFLFMNTLLQMTGGLFGLEPMLGSAVESGLKNHIDGFDIDVSTAGLREALAEKNLPEFLVQAVIDGVGENELPVGTTLAKLVGETIAAFTTSLVAFLIIFIVAKVVLKLIQKILSAVADKLSLIGAINRLLGFVVGALQGFLIVCAVVAAISLVPAAGVHTLFEQTLIAKWLYHDNPLHIVFSWFF